MRDSESQYFDEGTRQESKEVAMLNILRLGEMDMAVLELNLYGRKSFSLTS